MPDQNINVGSQNMLTNQVDINTGDAQLLLARKSKGTRSDVTFLNMDSANTVYIGSEFMSDGTTKLSDSNGFPLAKGAAITRRFQGDVYCYSPSGTVRVAYITDEDNT